MKRKLKLEITIQASRFMHTHDILTEDKLYIGPSSDKWDQHIIFLNFCENEEWAIPDQYCIFF